MTAAAWPAEQAAGLAMLTIRLEPVQALSRGEVRVAAAADKAAAPTKA